MGEERVAGLRGVVDWMLTAREEAEPALRELLALPEAAWDEWLESHPAVGTVPFFEAFVELAERNPYRANGLTSFLIRHVDSAIAPGDAEITLTFLRGHAWRVRAFALLRAGDPRGALEAYERGAAVFRSEPLATPELEAIELAAASVQPGLVARLLSEMPRAEWPRLAAREELQSIGALTELSGEVFRRAEVVPIEAVAIAEIATAIADALPAGSHAGSVIAHLRTQAWKDRGLALGALARYPQALAAFDRAEEIAGGFASLGHDRATVRLARAMTLQEAGRLDESMALLAECKTAFEEYGDVRRRLAAASAEGALLYRAGRFSEARAAYLALLPAAHQSGDLYLLSGVHNNLGHILIELGDFEAAGAHLDQAVALFATLGQPLRAVRSELARGRMLIRTGDLAAAIDHLHTVRGRFLEQNLVEEAGLCGLDIVEAHLLRGAPIEAEAFARQIVREFTAAHLSSRAIMALGYLSDAITAREASAGTVGRVRRYIRSLRTQPDADFAATA